MAFSFRLYAADGDDLSVREFSEPNWRPGDTVALADQVYRVRDVVYLDEADDARGLSCSRIAPMTRETIGR
jgi:hypothetical protein